MTEQPQDSSTSNTTRRTSPTIVVAAAATVPTPISTPITTSAPSAVALAAAALAKPLARTHDILQNNRNAHDRQDEKDGRGGQGGGDTRGGAATRTPTPTHTPAHHPQLFSAPASQSIPPTTNHTQRQSQAYPQQHSHQERFYHPSPQQQQQQQQQHHHYHHHPPLPPPSSHTYIPDDGRDQFYRILGELDPYRVTPKEFIHLLVHAAVRDPEIADGLFRLNSDRINNPNTWRPPAPPNFATQTPPYHPPPSNSSTTIPPASANASTRTQMGASSGPLAQPDQSTASLAAQRKRKRDGGDGVHTTTTPTTSEFGIGVPRMVMYCGPQQPPPPLAHTEPPQNNSFVPQNQLQTIVSAPAPIPPPFSGPRGRSGLEETSPPVVSIQSTAPMEDGSTKDNPIEPIDGEPQESSCDYTWALDRAETHLGFTGNYDKASEIRQTSIGYEVALTLQKMLRKLNVALDKHVTLANRVHILTVMREIIAATLEADHAIGMECRQSCREFDSTYLAAVHKLTPEQLKRLRTLEGGKWREEMQIFVAEANRLAIFPLLTQALDHINSAV
ncbi:hypothetical protein SAMD00023353_1101830 [Rosellinia necatrix]|uniref:Uncharacterized protein n=1 Tax=Rosellinia necatrix TaxID=77044 RepID=A0A1S7UMR1_ROSNE|nr:hypothetical protein SAMD00023353_1101830 [Rosellinia necatrix]